MSPHAKPLTSKRLALILLGLAILLALFLNQVVFGPGYETEAFRGPIMGTQYMVKVRAPDGDFPGGWRNTVSDRITESLQLVDEEMSTYRPDSDVSRFNAHQSTEPFSVSSEVIEVVRIAEDISKRTGGAFDITVGPLVDAWGFGPKKKTVPPSDQEIETAFERVGYEKLNVDAKNNTLRKTQPDLEIDLSAIAKGYAVDLVAENLKDLGVEHYLVEVGGEIRAKGVTADGRSWTVGIEKPLPNRREVHRTLQLSGAAMATSGDYRNFYEANGQRYAHTIDPRTGRPVEHNTVSVTVISEQCALADAWATGLMVLGAEEGIEVDGIAEIAVLFLSMDANGAISETSTDRFQELYLEANKPLR